VKQNLKRAVGDLRFRVIGDHIPDDRRAFSLVNAYLNRVVGCTNRDHATLDQLLRGERLALDLLRREPDEAWEIVSTGEIVEDADV
jgi:hypothetical protein